MDAIKAVTSVAARYLRQEDNVGSVAAGRYADFSILDGDPLRDVRELRSTTTVVRGGVRYSPAELLEQVPHSEVVS